jgi:hypothetical protein
MSRTRDRLVGRGGRWYYSSLFEVILNPRHFTVRATEIDCPDPIPE